MSQIFSTLVTGISQGGIIALMALGYVIVYRSTHTLNFAQGAFLVLGTYAAFWLSGPTTGAKIDFPPSLLRLPFLPTILIAMVLLGVFGWLMDVLVISKFRGRPVFAVIMATLGVGTVMGAVSSVIWGTSQLPLRNPFVGEGKFYRVFGASVSYVDIFTVGAVAVISVAFFFGFQRSKLGVAMKATAFDQEAAIAQGISPKVIFGLSWGLSAALAALAGILLACGAGALDSGAGPGIEKWAFLGFPAIVLGGVDSLEGAVAGGLIIGIVQAFAAQYEDKLLKIVNVGFEFWQLTPFILMITILLVRPAGLFGTKEVRRV
jgi:branched-chain amino acid transport system permease protein